MQLNSAQHHAVRYLDGPCLVLAGAGSGKTRVIIQKIAYLIEECAYSAKHILAVTFTNKAAKEMLERISHVLDKRSTKGLTVCTFHALGVRMLREEAAHLGLKEYFSIFDAEDSFNLIQELLKTTDKGKIRSVQSQISLWKNALVSPNQAQKIAQTLGEQEAAVIYHSYNATLTAYQAVDFDDLIRLPSELLMNNEEVRRRWQSRFHYLLIDEYQDTNACQYQLVRLLSGARAMFTAVGDDDQAIYAWRGATVENLAKLTEDYPSIKVIKLEQNYRSSQNILHAANKVIAHNPKLFDKALWSDHGTGDPIMVLPMANEQSEAEAVVMRVSAARVERQATWKDFAILYRSNHQARVFEQALRSLHIPYQLAGGQSFFDKSEIRDILAYLRLIANEDDDPAFIRAVTTPKRGIGQATLEALGTFSGTKKTSLFATIFDEELSAHMPERGLNLLREFANWVERLQLRAGRKSRHGDLWPAEKASILLDDLLGLINYEHYLYDTYDEKSAQVRWQNVNELCQWLKRKADEDDLGLLDLVQHIALVTRLEKNDDEEPNAVKLSTLHASKGLEYPHVYLVGVEEGLLPHLGNDDEEGDPEKQAVSLASRIQEERRLMYVGITRARRSLTLTWCKQRRRAREYIPREPSRFIKEMGIELDKPVDHHQGMSAKDRLGLLKGLLNK